MSVPERAMRTVVGFQPGEQMGMAGRAAAARKVWGPIGRRLSGWRERVREFGTDPGGAAIRASGRSMAWTDVFVVPLLLAGRGG